MTSNTQIYCNPLSLPYKFQNFKAARTMNREAADPSVVWFKDRYWLFASMSDGFWWSKDLATWVFHKGLPLPATDYAPDVRVINETLYVCASKRGESCPIYRSPDPLKEGWEKVAEPFAFWDPNLFQDEDGRVYFYWGCENNKPIFGVEMDPTTLEPLNEPVGLIYGAPKKHGWERRGDNYEPEKIKGVKDLVAAALIRGKPYIEGAWMTKHQGKYYLQYSAPGTEFNTYADGVYVAGNPLGPFTYAAHNPFSLKPGGFITGAGHGSTFQDRHGNWWHISTMRISVKHMFERRIGLFPAGFDEDGVLFSNSHFGDYPKRLANKPWNPWVDSETGWMLLSYQKPVTASSETGKHPAINAVDEDIRTFWTTDVDDAQGWLQVDLNKICTVNAIQLNFADKSCIPPERQARDYTGPAIFKRTIEHGEDLQFLLEGSVDGETWTILADRRDAHTDLPHECILLEPAKNLRFVRVTGHNMPFGGNLAMSGLRVFGKADGALPQRIEAFSAKRTDPLTADLSWAPVGGAVGYNIRWGISPKKLYSSWLVYDQNQLKLGALSANTDYWIAVDAFNECGVSHGVPKPLSL